MTRDFAGTEGKRSRGISERRDRVQSTAVAILAGSLVLYATAFALLANGDQPGTGTLAIVSAVFAIAVVIARASSIWGAIWGGICCFTLTMWTREAAASMLHSLLSPLALLVLLTLAATRLGRARKAAKGLGERADGRVASQILANLGAAVIFVSPIGAYAAAATGSTLPVSTALLIAAGLAALAEAAADTVSSEVGQALAGSSRTILITTFRRVPRGTDGGVSMVGTLSGLGAAIAVVGTGGGVAHISVAQGAAALAAAVFAFLFDSVLGATLERRGWIGNDLVNFASTVVAGMLTLLFARSSAVP